MGVREDWKFWIMFVHRFFPPTKYWLVYSAPDSEDSTDYAMELLRSLIALVTKRISPKTLLFSSYMQLIGGVRVSMEANQGRLLAGFDAVSLI